MHLNEKIIENVYGGKQNSQNIQSSLWFKHFYQRCHFTSSIWHNKITQTPGTRGNYPCVGSHRTNNVAASLDGSQRENWMTTSVADEQTNVFCHGGCCSEVAWRPPSVCTDFTYHVALIDKSRCRTTDLCWLFSKKDY